MFAKIYAFTVWCAYSLFGLYALQANSHLSWGHLYLLISVPVFVFLSPKGYCLKIDMRFLPVILYTLIQTAFILFGNRDLNEVSLLLKVLQWLLYLVYIAIFNNSFFSYREQKGALSVAVIFSCSYLLVQQFVYYIIKYPLPPGISWFPYVREDLKLAYVNLNRWGGVYRPRSFFSEPALFCQFALPALTFLIYEKSCKSVNDKYLIGLLTVSILVSKSGTGFFGLLFLGGYVVISALKNNRFLSEKRKTLFLASLPFTVLMLPLILLLPDVRVVVTRFFGGETLMSNLYNQERFAGIKSIALLTENIWQFLFGHGFTMEVLDENVFLAGIVRHYFCFGMIGLILFFSLLFQLYIKGNKVQKMMILMFLVVSIGANPMHSSDLLFYLAVPAAKSKIHRNLHEISIDPEIQAGGSRSSENLRLVRKLPL